MKQRNNYYKHFLWFFVLLSWLSIFTLTNSIFGLINFNSSLPNKLSQLEFVLVLIGFVLNLIILIWLFCAFWLFRPVQGFIKVILWIFGYLKILSLFIFLILLISSNQVINSNVYLLLYIFLLISGIIQIVFAPVGIAYLISLKKKG
ncbi:hypothetical protein [Mycoplasmopsis gallopavonis]|uniref:Uncharacterized protein n=1 Tax=Mycoplasmopsis gallopavonis TaxID=76629 RepID=A0A449B0F5_9BACT|nr:hypothetical protein [Mycoplasmopsis gallopavonis]RIV16549.1 hypothetical protein D1113_01925 [Mycoplasmopsis gallopavonis]VEU73224.1 Uncharacterised protein [Mycoplasmopsis gallopavonis]